MKVNLNPLSHEILKILDLFDGWLFTHVIVDLIKLDVFLATYGPVGRVFYASKWERYVRVGATVGSLYRRGLLMKKEAVDKNHYPQWKLGPVSDLLKEEGRL